MDSFWQIVYEDEYKEMKSLYPDIQYAISNLMDIPVSIWEKVITNSFPEKLVKVNLTAFQMGRDD